MLHYRTVACNKLDHSELLVAEALLVLNMPCCHDVCVQAFQDMQKGDRDAMKRYNELQVKQLTKLIELTRTDLARPDRTKVMNMITIDAHSRDMVQVGSRLIMSPVDVAPTCRCYCSYPLPECMCAPWHECVTAGSHTTRSRSNTTAACLPAEHRGVWRGQVGLLPVGVPAALLLGL
jgi:hypothetical protein